MYKSMAVINGALIAVMILSNGLMVKAFGNTPSVLLNHLIGLSFAASIFILSKSKWCSLREIPVFYLLAGITGIFTVYFTNVAFLALGATVSIVLSMFGRIITSAVIDHYGLMGMKKYHFKPIKLIGLFFMFIGVILIIIT
ncbi:MAG: DMT family transporter [Clostridiales bacterium]